jgi:hypothetical protein
MTQDQINQLTPDTLRAISDSDLQHLIDCQNDCSLMGNSWGKTLQAEDDRRSKERRMNNEIADACVAALGDRGAQPEEDVLGDSAKLFR